MKKIRSLFVCEVFRSRILVVKMVEYLETLKFTAACGAAGFASAELDVGSNVSVSVLHH